MTEGFFSQFFEETKPTERLETPQAQVSRPKPPQPPFQPSVSGSLEARLATLETELAKEKEKALTYGLRLKEMENARGAVEEMFEKMWAKASKERLEEEMRMIRERALGRVEALEKRLDDFQKAFLDIVKEWGLRKSSPSDPLSEDFKQEFSRKMVELERLIKTIQDKKVEPQGEQKPPQAANVSELDESLQRVEEIFNRALRKKGDRSDKGEKGE